VNVLFLGGDKRYLEIINYFVDRKVNVDLVGFINNYPNTNNKRVCDIDISKYHIIFFPINGVMENYIIKGEENIVVDENLLKGSKDDVLIFSGIKTRCLDSLLKKSYKEAIYLMEEKDVVLDNAVITVEGILADIISNTEISINGANIMVIGYGNIGKKLVDILRYLRANVLVAVRSEDDYICLKHKGIYTVYSDDSYAMKVGLNVSDIIINTVPSLILDTNYIDNVQNNAYVLDIASYPYGIDKDYLDEKQIKNKIYPGIPGKVAPISAGRILTKKIEKILGGE